MSGNVGIRSFRFAAYVHRPFSENVRRKFVDIVDLPAEDYEDGKLFRSQICFEDGRVEMEIGNDKQPLTLSHVPLSRKIIFFLEPWFAVRPMHKYTS